MCVDYKILSLILKYFKICTNKMHKQKRGMQRLTFLATTIILFLRSVLCVAVDQITIVRDMVTK